LALGLSTGLVACASQRPAASPPGTLTAFAGSVAPRDAFSGLARATSGREAGHRGPVRVRLHPGSPAGRGSVTVAITSPACRRARHCLALAGSLTGTLSVPLRRPDRGAVSRLLVRGRLTAIGETVGRGQVTGTGNIRFGHESLVLTLDGATGTVGIDARSGQVPGYTTP
jgi:hypothetical protein